MERVCYSSLLTEDDYDLLTFTLSKNNTGPSTDSQRKNPDTSATPHYYTLTASLVAAVVGILWVCLGAVYSLSVVAMVTISLVAFKKVRNI